MLKRVHVVMFCNSDIKLYHFANVVNEFWHFCLTLNQQTTLTKISMFLRNNLYYELHYNI